MDGAELCGMLAYLYDVRAFDLRAWILRHGWERVEWCPQLRERLMFGGLIEWNEEEIEALEEYHRAMVEDESRAKSAGEAYIVVVERLYGKARVDE